MPLSHVAYVIDGASEVMPTLQRHEGDGSHGRPYPHMVLRNMLELDVSPVQSVAKIDILD